MDRSLQPPHRSTEGWNGARRLLVALSLLTLLALPCLADQIGQNLVQNSGFEDGIEGWDERGQPIVRDAVAPFAGEFSCKSVGHEGLPHPHFHWVKSVDIPCEPQREYMFRTMLRASFSEGVVAPQVREVDETGTTIQYHIAETLTPGDYDWHRAACRFYTSRTAHALQIYLVIRDCIGTAWYDDVELFEMQLAPLPPLGTGAAVTFDGGPGALQMRVEEPATLLTYPAQTLVQTTGARFVLREDGEALVISASQRIGAERESYDLRIEPPPGPLRALRTDETVAALGNAEIELGFQCDSLLAIAPGRDTTLTITGKYGGAWTQNVSGNVQVTDDVGGVGIYPYVPDGARAGAVDQEPGDLSQPG